MTKKHKTRHEGVWGGRRISWIFYKYYLKCPVGKNKTCRETGTCGSYTAEKLGKRDYLWGDTNVGFNKQRHKNT